MTITLTVGATTLDLSDDLYWSDEYTWQPVEQGVERTLTGGFVLSTAVRDGGRPITLQPFDEQSAWATYAQLLQLRNWAANAGQQMTLTIRGAARTVVFRHHEGPAIEANPVAHFSAMDNADFYRVTLRFMEL